MFTYATKPFVCCNIYPCRKKTQSIKQTNFLTAVFDCSFMHWQTVTNVNDSYYKEAKEIDVHIIINNNKEEEAHLT